MTTGLTRWDMSRCWYFYPPGWHDLYYIQMDGTEITINGKTYKKLYHTTHHAPGTEFDSTYTHFLGGIREEGKQVFMVSEYLCLDTIERMIYDFNPTDVGDTIFTQVLTNGLTQFVPHIVLSEDQVMVDGEFHRRINLRDESGFFTESWIEGVGSTQGLPYASYWLLTDNSYDLHCVYKGIGLTFENENQGFTFCTPPFPETDCALLLPNPDPRPNAIVVTINPNPFFATLHIESTFSFQTLELYTVTGMLVMEIPFEPEIDCSRLPSGLYILRLKSNQRKEPILEKIIKL